LHTREEVTLPGGGPQNWAPQAVQVASLLATAQELMVAITQPVAYKVIGGESNPPGQSARLTAQTAKCYLCA